MPIQFEAPQPFSASIASGYGAAEQSSRDLPVIANLYGQAAHINAQANQSAADNQYRQAAALGQQRLQGSEFQAQQEAQAREFDLHRQVAAAQVDNQRFNQSLQLAEYQRRPEEMQRQFELKAELHNAEMTQQENLRLKQLKEYQGAIDNMTEYSPAEKEDLKLQVQAKISPLAARKAKFEAMQAEQHAQLYQAQAQRQTEVALKNAELNAKTMEDRTVTSPTPEGLAQARRELGADAPQDAVRQRAIDNGHYSQWVQVGFDQYGHPSWKQVENKHAVAKEAAAAQTEIVRQKDYEAAVQRVERSVERWATARDKKATEAGQAPLTAEEYHQNVLDELQKFGLAPTWEEQRARAAAGRPIRPTAGAAGQPATPEPGSGQIPAPAPQPPVVQKPFDLTKPETASPEQRTIQTGMDNSLAAVAGRDDLSEARRTRATLLINTLKTLHAKGGSFDNLSPEDQKRVAYAMKEIGELPPRPTKPRNTEAERQSRYPSYIPAGVAGAPLGR